MMDDPQGDFVDQAIDRAEFKLATDDQGLDGEGVELTQGNILWKPFSDADGNLVILFPYESGGVTIEDRDGNILAQGGQGEPSNGYADTVRIGAPGSAFQNVIVKDGAGNVFFVSEGSQRDENLGSKKV